MFFPELCSLLETNLKMKAPRSQPHKMLKLPELANVNAAVLDVSHLLLMVTYSRKVCRCKPSLSCDREMRH